MKKEEFVKELEKLNIKVTDNQLHQLDEYYNLLIEWNKVMNLTGITEKEEVYLKHFYDSITITKVIDFNNVETLCDVGSGAGFPGLVIKILFPNLQVTLVDSLNKRINFLNEVIKKLELKKINTIHTRIEEFGIKNREKYDIVVARAVAQLNILLEYCIPITKVNSYFIAMKGNCFEEINKSKNALDKLNSHIEECNSFNLPIENSNRTIIKIKKDVATDKKFPRKYSEIKKRPL